jgi:putative membrane fusion protein
MKKTIKRDSFAIILVVALILVYVFYECYSVTHIELQTQTAVPTTIYETIDTTALIVRDERIVSNSTSGVTVACFSTGDKINVGGNVAVTFSSSEMATNYSKYSALQSEIEYYENIESQTVGQASNVESINDEIYDNIDEYIRASNALDCDKIDEVGSQINDNLLRRQMIIGEDVDLTTTIQELRNEAQQYAASTTPSSYITTDTSGVFSTYTDGFEQLVDYSTATEMTVDDVKSALQKVETANDTSSNLGKLVTSYNWYLECVVPAEQVKGLENGDKLKVALKDNDENVLTTKIVSGADTSVGADETVLVLECNELNESVINLRSEDIQIRINTYTGIKVPTSALHVVDDEKGVYALISSQVKFRPAEVIYSEDDYVLLSYDAENTEGIRLYDKIITQGKDLEDGKVYT